MEVRTETASGRRVPHLHPTGQTPSEGSRGTNADCGEDKEGLGGKEDPEVRRIPQGKWLAALRASVATPQRQADQNLLTAAFGVDPLLLDF